jgi:Xaa-Pro aminopeptidase
VQFDYAPDYKYYQSDVTRVFPANGKFTPRQREYYDIYLRLYRAVMTSIKVHAAPHDVIKEAVVKMDEIMAGYKFTDGKIKSAAQKFVENYRRQQDRATSLGHSVGWKSTTCGCPPRRWNQEKSSPSSRKCALRKTTWGSVWRTCC